MESSTVHISEENRVLREFCLFCSKEKFDNMMERRVADFNLDPELRSACAMEIPKVLSLPSDPGILSDF